MTEHEKTQLLETLNNFPVWHSTLKETWMPQAIEKLADYLFEEGMIAPPCKVGTTVYRILENGPNNWILGEGVIVEIRQRIGQALEIIEQRVSPEGHCEYYPIPFYTFGKSTFCDRKLAEEAIKKLTNTSGKILCRECGSEMYLDDKDINFKGNYDNYWNCKNCQTSCIEQVRFSQRWKEIWHSENNDEVKDYEFKYNIVTNK